MPSAAPKTHDAYLAKVPPKQRAALLKLRNTIRAAAPEAEEIIAYQIPSFRQDGYLVGYAAFSKHLSFFPGSVVAQIPSAKPFRAGRGTLQFTPEKPLPASLVKLIVRRRVADNKARAAARRARKRA